MNVLPVFMATRAEPCAWLSPWHDLMTANLSACCTDVGKIVRDQQSTLATWAKGTKVGCQEANLASAGIDVRLVRRQRLSRIFFQFGLVVKRVDLTGSPIHHQENAALGLRLKMRGFGRQRIRRDEFFRSRVACKEPILFQQRRQRESRESGSHLPDEFAPRMTTGKKGPFHEYAILPRRGLLSSWKGS